MGRTRWLIIVLLILILLTLIGISTAHKDNIRKKKNDVSAPIYKSDHSDIFIYDLEGSLNYHFYAQHVEYFSKQGVSWFTKPMVIAFDINKIPTWLIQSNKAKLTNDHILYLYDYVEISSLTSNAHFQKIMTSDAQINLVTRDVVSQGLVKLHGTKFNSSALKMRGNLQSKNAELLEKVKTLYEIHNK